MRINKLSAIGGIAGTVLMLSSWIRYFIMFPDLDKALGYGATGFCIIAISFLWDRVVRIEHTLYDVEEYLADKSIEGKTYG